MMTLQTLLPNLQLSTTAAAVQIKSLCLDSRRMHQGAAFIAVSGEQSDGRLHIDTAVHAGAVAVLAEAEHFSEAEQGGVPIIGVPALRSQLGQLAGRFYQHPEQQLTLLGVTGTNGKTSVSWFLRDAMNALEQPCALLGTLGASFADYHSEASHTTPDVLSLYQSLAAFHQHGARFVAMEVSSHALAQNRLAGLSVAVAGFTNLSRDHLDYHGDMDQYFLAKKRLFHRHGITCAVINTDDHYGARLADELTDNIRCVRVGQQAGEVCCVRASFNERGIEADIRVAGSVVSLSVPLYGDFTISNLLLVAGILAVQGFAASDIARALNAVTPVPGRMQPVLAVGGPVVLVDFAHTPAGLEQALTSVRRHFSGKLWCVVGCGGNRDVGKRPQMAAIAERLSDRLILTADNPRQEPIKNILADMLSGVKHGDSVEVQIERPAAIASAIQQAAAGDIVLIAGKGHEQWQEIGGRRIAMDDRLLAAAALAAREEARP